MALPPYFGIPKDYFEECVLFFKEYRHLYDFANTDILLSNVLDDINLDNFENIDVFEKDFELQKVAEQNKFLKGFFASLKRFKVSCDDFIEDDSLETKVDVPLSPKKRHEILYMAKEITGICTENECFTVVDFGSGLGYLDQLIYEMTKFKVLGFECNDSHYVGAKKRQRKYHEDSTEHVKYIKHTISEFSDTNIQYYLEDKFVNPGAFCMAGLHCCADLTVDAVNLFLKMDDAKSLVLIPCCYHKMKIECSDGQRFKNFPLSKCLKEVFGTFEGFKYMRIPFLRLAAQPPCRRDDALEDAVFNLLARAVLQLYASRHNYKLSRNKRKAVKLKTMDNDFEHYIQDASTTGFTLRNIELPYIDYESNKKHPIQFDLVELKSIWRQISENLTFKRAAIFILLQNCLQPVIENFVLYDRLQYLKEKGIEKCRYKKIFNEKISPRCLALLAYK